MDWLADNWVPVAAIAYAAVSEIVGISPLKSNSVVQIILWIAGRIVGKK